MAHLLQKNEETVKNNKFDNTQNKAPQMDALKPANM